MCARIPHDVPPYQAVAAGVMRGWLLERVLGLECRRVECYAFSGQPPSVTGQRRTAFPFGKFFLGGCSQVQDERGEVVMETRPGDMVGFRAESWANVQYIGPVDFFRVTLLPEETFLAFNEIVRVQPGDIGSREERVQATVLSGPPSRLIRELWARLELWSEAEGRADVWRLMVREWCAVLERAADAASGGTGRGWLTRRAEVMDYLERNAHRLINRASVAGALGMSPGELSRLFQRTGDEGFNETLNRIRLEHAKDWLRRDGVSVADVAARCGFASANYFAQVFRRAEGVGPLAWRAAGGGQ